MEHLGYVFWHAHIFSVGQRPQSKETLCLIYGMYRLSKSQDMILKYMLRVKVQSSTFTHNLVDLTTFFPPIVVVLIYLHIYIICNESMRCCFHKSVFANCSTSSMEIRANLWIVQLSHSTWRCYMTSVWNCHDNATIKHQFFPAKSLDFPLCKLWFYISSDEVPMFSHKVVPPT